MKKLAVAIVLMFPALATSQLLPPGPGQTPLPSQPDVMPSAPRQPLYSHGLTQVSLCVGYGEAVLNYFELNTEPMRVEFSLNGGPWQAAKYGKIVVPDIGLGFYYITIITYPRSGKRFVENVKIEHTATEWKYIAP